MNTTTLVTLIGLGIIAVFSTITAPLILAHRTERIHREDREADWKRQDKVAASALTAVKAQADAAEKAAQFAQTADKKLTSIHTLVNSQMTAAIQSELDATRRELAMMREVIALNEAAGRKPAIESLNAIVATETRIDELQAAILQRDRKAAQAGTEASF